MTKPDRRNILRQISETEQEIVHLRARQIRAETKLRSLKDSLSEYARETIYDFKIAEGPNYEKSDLSRTEKISLFLRLFQGPEDVYPRLWQNQRTDKEGCAPACANEWVKGVCEKPRMKCGQCTNQAFLPVTAEAILDHLQGRHVMVCVAKS